ncbi:MAG: hypothetical protein ACM3SY_05630, partial [Candidatus Omnitrophota bacterium]
GGEVMATIAEQWMKEGMEKNKWEMVANLLREGLPVDLIARASGIPIEKIEEFKLKQQHLESAA